MNEGDYATLSFLLSINLFFGCWFYFHSNYNLFSLISILPLAIFVVFARESEK